MDKQTYINKLKAIRNSIGDLIYELWSDHSNLWSDSENKECYMYISSLRRRVINDIIYGYENE